MPAVFEFGEFVLDCERFELRRGPHRVRLERKPLDLLILLASSGGRLVTRDEIARCLWPSEVYVDTEHGINTAIRKIRHALRENPDHPRFLLTVIGKGYRFTGATLQPAPELPAVPNPIQLSSPIDPARQPTLSEARYPEPTPSAALHPEQSGPTPGVEPPLQFAETAYTPVETGAPAQPERSGTGLDSETSVSPSPASSSQAHKLWVTVSAAALVAAIAIGFGVRTTHAHAVKPSITSIAVLPLDNVSGDPTQNYLADGMTDELITQLAKDSSLRVISRTSVMQFKGAHRPLPEIARQLNVDGILEGSIGRSGNNLHMTVQLIHGPSDTHLWAESYDRYDSDTVSLPQEAALSIARQTHSAIVSATPPQKYVNPAAHDAYLRGNFHWFSGDQAGAAPYYKQATEIQPDYAAA